jgi:hypothetical protein
MSREAGVGSRSVLPLPLPLPLGAVPVAEKSHVPMEKPSKALSVLQAKQVVWFVVLNLKPQL